MRIMPFGRMLPVHCCCDPAKRLGWVPVPDKLHERGCGPVRFQVGLPSYELLTGVVTQPDQIDTTIERLIDGDEEYLAVKSAEQPVDVWRKVPGFLEDQIAVGYLKSHDAAGEPL